MAPEPRPGPPGAGTEQMRPQPSAHKHPALDADRKTKCWDFASHLGCRWPRCLRSHEDIQPQKVHWSVQAALIRRG
eukprot:12363450-Heterocapsa_arctica.AAC.1